MQAAERKRYTLRRVEFYGNVKIPDPVLRRRILLNEGDVFNRKNLVRSIERLNRLKTLKLVRLSDVVIRLDKQEKEVDIVICFKERQSSKALGRPLVRN